MGEGQEHSEWGAGWEATRKRKLLLGSRTTAAERLRWLEEALRIAEASGALARRRARDRARDGRWDSAPESGSGS